MCGHFYVQYETKSWESKLMALDEMSCPFFIALILHDTQMPNIKLQEKVYSHLHSFPWTSNILGQIHKG